MECIMMNLKWLLILIFLPVVAFAQKAIEIEDVDYFGGVKYDSALKEFTLTEDGYYQAGDIYTKNGFCAREYKLSFDVFVGDKNADKNGGAGVVLYELNADSGNTWMNLLEFNVQDHARRSNFNFIESFKFNDGPTELVARPAPFPMGGAGYLHVDYYMNSGHSLSVITHDLGSVVFNSSRTYIPGLNVKHRIYGWTGAARNVQKVKNLELHLLNLDGCPSVQPVIPEQELDLWQEGYDTGYETAKDECLQDTTTAYDLGFQDGVLSIDIEGLEAESYALGFSDGQKQVCTAPIEDEDKKVLICYKLKTISVNKKNLKRYLARGASVGACTGANKRRK